MNTDKSLENNNVVIHRIQASLLHINKSLAIINMEEWIEKF
ncbi:hypothetical protein COMNV_01633 [Commensalibacter sp. Nvir]|nr:hypothetical protein COMNV_01633 [Commensalibacter sp. Nvir]